MFAKLSDRNNDTLVQDVTTKGLGGGLGRRGSFGGSGRGVVIIRWNPMRKFIQAGDCGLLGYLGMVIPSLRSW